MKATTRVTAALAPSIAALLLVAPLMARQEKPATLPSETPAKLVPVTDGFDYTRRDVMIPVRDGVQLHTVVLVPRAPGARRSS